MRQGVMSKKDGMENVTDLLPNHTHPSGAEKHLAAKMPVHDRKHIRQPHASSFDHVFDVSQASFDDLEHYQYGDW